MSDAREDLSPVKRALIEIRELRARLQEAERARTEPIAVIGLGVRLPGQVRTPADFWRLLDEGRDAITEVPRDRWDPDEFHAPAPETPGRMASRSGGFLSEVDRFDARFFGVTPREAVAMDPQQRLLLETAWEALEHGGQAPDGLVGHPTGVFVGISTSDYFTSQVKFSPLDRIDAYLASGGTPSVAAGRISYTLGLQGPCMTVDTACSSSLAAIHLASQSLRLGECRMALAGGVNVILLPEINVNLSQAHMLAPDGRCKTFDRSADGYVRSEGCAVVVLKRLADARAAGDPILAVIRGSALNQDGRSSGLTVPNGPAQEAVVREALSRAGVMPSAVDYVEAHGTGTSLGDPIELRALGNVFADLKAEGRRLRIGSVKTNLGHLEAAAGVAGLVKVILALQHERIPPHLNVTQLTEHVSWPDLPLEVSTSGAPWRRDPARPRIAGISSFGFSGTNAHVVLEEPPQIELARATLPERPVHILTLSAKTEEALRTAAGQLARHLAGSTDALADVCHTASAGRAHFAVRAAMPVSATATAVERLVAIAAGREAPAVQRGHQRPGATPEVAFLFAGLGSEHVGMGRELFETEPVFRSALLTCETLLQPYFDPPLTSILYPEPGRASRLAEPAIAQPALFAFEFALAEMWRAWGVTPSFVLGHSLGEDVAACVAGVFPLEQGLAMVAERARLMQDRLDPGAMSAVFGPEPRVRELVAPLGGQVSIAAINGPQQVVLSGTPTGVRDATRLCEAAGLKVRPLATSRACHSPLMDPVLDAVEAIAAGMTLSPPRLGVVSNVSGRLASGRELADPSYWRRHVREAVRFSDGLETLHREGARLLVEIGPQGTLTGMGCRCVRTDDVVWLQSLRRDAGNWEQVLSTLAALYVNGVPVRWAELDRGRPRTKVALPTYPFQRERYWSAAVPARRAEPALDGVPGEIEWANEWLHELVWRERPYTGVMDRPSPDDRAGALAPAVARAARAARGRRWLILADRQGIGAHVAAQLRNRGLSATTARPAGANGSPADLLIDPADPRAFDDLVSSVEPDAVLHLWSLDAPGIDELTPESLRQAALNGCGSALHLVQALVRRGAATPVWLGTADAVATCAGDAVTGVAQSPLWGLGRVIALEHTEYWGGLIDIGSSDPAVAGDRILGEVLFPDAEDQVAWRGGTRVVPRVVRRDRVRTRPVRLRADASYLITGGTGGLGLSLAAWMAEHGAKHLVLTSRSGAAPPESIAAIEARGATVIVQAADVADPDAMTTLVGSFGRVWPPLRGVVHGAADISFDRLRTLSLETLQASFEPKLVGTHLLDRLTAGGELDFFLLFSSIAAVLGSLELGAYASSNAFLGSYAAARRRGGSPMTAIAWGAWERMRGGEARHEMVVRGGLRKLPMDRGLEAFGQLLRPEPAELLVADVDWPTLTSVYEARAARPVFEEVGRAGQAAAPDAPAVSDLRRRLESSRPADRLEALAAHVRTLAAEVLGFAPDEVDPLQGLFDMGMDSLMSVALKARLEAAVGQALPTTLAFNYPSVTAIAEYLASHVLDLTLARPAGDAPVMPALPAPPAPAADDDLSDDEVAAMLAARLAAMEKR